MKIVLTGGPCAGKTTIANALKSEFDVHYVREAATLLFEGGFPRSNDVTPLKHRQRAIYFVQRELEAIASSKKPDKALLCDRGSMDGAGYWPDGQSEDFYESIGTTEESEMKRYDWVIHMEVSGKNHYQSDDRVRTDTYEQALDIDARIKTAWSKHAKRIIIPQFDTISLKLERCEKIFQAILENQPLETVQGILLNE